MILRFLASHVPLSAVEAAIAIAATLVIAALLRSRGPQ